MWETELRKRIEMRKMYKFAFSKYNILVVNDPEAPWCPPCDPMPSRGIYMSSHALACHYTKFPVYLVSRKEGGF